MAPVIYWKEQSTTECSQRIIDCGTILLCTGRRMGRGGFARSIALRRHPLVVRVPTYISKEDNRCWAAHYYPQKRKVDVMLSLPFVPRKRGNTLIHVISSYALVNGGNRSRWSKLCPSDGGCSALLCIALAIMHWEAQIGAADVKTRSWRRHQRPMSCARAAL